MGRQYVSDVFKAAVECANEVVSAATPDVTAGTEGLKSTWDRNAFTRGVIDPVLGQEGHTVSKAGNTFKNDANGTTLTDNEIQVHVKGDGASTDVIVTTSAKGNNHAVTNERHQEGSEYIGNEKYGDRTSRAETKEPFLEEEAISPQPPPWTKNTAENIKNEIDDCVQDRLNAPDIIPPPSR